MSTLHEILGTCIRTSGFVDDVMFSHNGPDTNTGLATSATQRIIHRDSPGGAAKLRTRGEVCYRRLACFFGVAWPWAWGPWESEILDNVMHYTALQYVRVT